MAACGRTLENLSLSASVPLPEGPWLGSLRNLRSASLDSPHIVLTRLAGGLPQLQSLRLSDCREGAEMCSLPASLTGLNLTGIGLRELPAGLPSLTHLQDLVGPAACKPPT